MSSLFLMLGYPGSGKTTTSKLLHTQTGAVHLWADHERKKMFTPPVYDHAENLKLYAHLNDVVDELLAQGKSVIFDTNFNFYKDRQKLRAIAAKHGVPTYLLWVVTPKEVAQARATENAHLQHTRILGDMPVEDFERMARDMEQPRPDEHTITLDGTDITADAIAAMLQKL